MKNIITLLGLADSSSEADIVADLQKRITAHTEAAAEIERLRNLARNGLPKSITAEMLEQKIVAGLPKAQAIDVLLNQAAHDATKPHDPLPGEAPAKAKK